MKLGFVGLGAMGLPMTRHLLEAGHQVTVRRAAAARSTWPCRSAPSTGRSPAGVAEASEVVVLCVPTPRRWSRSSTMLPALGPGKMVVDCSTIDPDVARAQHAG